MTEEIIFKVGVNTGNTAKDLDKIDKELKSISNTSKEIASIDKRFEDLNKRVESGTMTMRESTKAIKDYQTIALQAGADSPVGAQAIANAAKLTDELGDLKNAITNASHDGANMQAALQLGSGVAAGYGVMQGTMALLGSESEDLQKTFVKLQAVQAVLAGIEQIRATLEKESFLMMKAKTIATKVQTGAEIVYAAAVGGTTGAMKVLRIAMISLPIIAIIAGIVALISALAFFSSSSETAAEGNDRLDASLKRMNESIDESNKKLLKSGEDRLKLLESQGASEEVLHKQRLQNIDNEEAARKYSMKGEIESIKHKQLALTNARNEENWELAKTIQDEIKASQGKYKALAAQHKDHNLNKEIENNNYNSDLSDSEEEAQKKAAEKQKKYNEDAKKRREEQAKLKLEEARMLQDLIALNIKDADEREIAQLAIKHQREREEIIAKYGKNSVLIKELDKRQADETIQTLEAQEKAKADKQKENDIKKLESDKLTRDTELTNQKAHLEAKLLRIHDDFLAEQELKAELALFERDQLLLNDKLTAGEREKIEAEYQNKVRDLNQETATKERDGKLKAANEALEWAQKSVDAIQSVTDAAFAIKMSKVEKGSKEEEKLARQQFKINKSLQLGGAIIDAGKAITASLASAPIAIGAVPNPAGIASLAFASITSAANIAKIAATKFESSTNTDTVQPPSLSNSSAVQEPTLTATAGLSGSGTEQPKTTKIIVVDSEITAKQASSNVALGIATIY